MGIGFSSSTVNNTQIANSNITQQFSGSCNITCQNKMSNASIISVNSHIEGGIQVTQACSVNGQCLIGNQSTAIADVVFKANNAATAALSGIGITISTTNSYQQINENIQTYVTENCTVSSTNDMNNVDVYSVNSSITGGIKIGQTGDATGNCTLTNIMNASATATGISDSCAASGKASKKKACSGKGKGGGIGSIILYGIVGFIAFIVIMMIVKFMKGRGLPPCTPQMPQGTPCTPAPKMSPATTPGLSPQGRTQTALQAKLPPVQRYPVYPANSISDVSDNANVPDNANAYQYRPEKQEFVDLQ